MKSSGRTIRPLCHYNNCILCIYLELDKWKTLRTMRNGIVKSLERSLTMRSVWNLRLSWRNWKKRIIKNEKAEWQTQQTHMSRMYNTACTFYVTGHNVDGVYSIRRVPECLSLCRNWTQRGRGQHSLAGEGMGGPNSDDWKESPTLCILIYSVA
jgi:hypothetical protein